MKVVLVIACLMVVLVGMAQAVSSKQNKEKAIYVYLLSQTLRCYRGDEVVFSTNISSGKGWGAPGSGKKLEYRPVYHVLWKDPRGAKATSRVVPTRKTGKVKIAKTPWKLVLSWDYGHYVRIHGYRSVPKRPASHGCLRVPLVSAKRVYDFADVRSKKFEGTSVYIVAGKAPEVPNSNSVQVRHPRKKAS